MILLEKRSGASALSRRFFFGATVGCIVFAGRIGQRLIGAEILLMRPFPSTFYSTVGDNRGMTPEQIVVEIAREICSNFLNERRPTRRHDLIVRFEITNLLSEMETRGLCKAPLDREEYLPSAGSFAVLPSEDEFYQKAEAAFTASVRLLRHLFRTGGTGASYPAEILLEKAPEAGVQLDAEGLALGLYLCQDFGILTPLRVSEDRMRVESCGIGEHVINLKEPTRDWAHRACFAREAMPKPMASINLLQAGFDEDLLEDYPDDGEGADFWALLHPSIVPEARKRFRARFYAEAVLAALKVISLQIKSRTGLDLDGAQLMTKAFAPSQPFLVFDPADTETARSIQQGYLQIFAGTMMAVRNPKAHEFVEIDASRCIHFLFLASLLAHKLDEALDVPVS